MKVLHSLAETSHAVVQTSSLRQMLHRLASTAGPLLGADHCAVLTVDEEGTRLGIETLWSRGRRSTRARRRSCRPTASGAGARGDGAHGADASGAPRIVRDVRRHRAERSHRAGRPHARLGPGGGSVALPFPREPHVRGGGSRTALHGGVAGGARRAERPADRGPDRAQRGARSVRDAGARRRGGARSGCPRAPSGGRPGAAVGDRDVRDRRPALRLGRRPAVDGAPPGNHGGLPRNAVQLSRPHHDCAGPPVGDDRESTRWPSAWTPQPAATSGRRTCSSRPASPGCAEAPPTIPTRSSSRGARC